MITDLPFFNWNRASGVTTAVVRTDDGEVHEVQLANEEVKNGGAGIVDPEAFLSLASVYIGAGTQPAKPRFNAEELAAIKASLEADDAEKAKADAAAVAKGETVTEVTVLDKGNMLATFMAVDETPAEGV